MALNSPNSKIITKSNPVVKWHIANFEIKLRHAKTHVTQNL